MRKIAVLAGGLGLLALAAPPPAHAIGCLSGGAMGALAGHQVHHGVLGAVGGCVAGHYAHKHAQQRALQDRNAAGNMPVNAGNPGQDATTGAPINQQ